MFLNQDRLLKIADQNSLTALFLTQRTGSSVFTRWMEKAFPDHPHYSYRTVSDFEHWRYLDKAKLDPYRLYSGFSDYVADEVARPLVPMSIVRHPLHRMASLFNMSRTTKTHIYHDLAAKGDFEKFYIEGSADRPYYFQNLCTRRIAGRPDFAQAQTAITDRFALVTSTNELGLVTDTLVELFGLEIAPLASSQTDEEKYADLLELPIARRILEENQHDLDLYKFIQGSADVPDLSSLKPRAGAVAAQKTKRPDMPATCPVCNEDVRGLGEGNNCPSCTLPARGRSLETLLRNYIGPMTQQSAQSPFPSQKPLLAFAATRQERQLLDPYFKNITSASLFGDYGPGHLSGVDVRDLSRFEDGSFSAVFGVLLFDYFTEHAKALAEISRILAPGGVLFTLILTPRVLAGTGAPIMTRKIEPRPGYFDYIPEGGELLNVKVGADWEVETMARAGLEPAQIRLFDPAGLEMLEWFIGRKPNARTVVSSRKDPEKPRPKQPAPSVHSDNMTPHFSQGFQVSVDPAFGFSKLHLDLSIPSVPKSARNCSFAEHKPGSDTVTAVLTGGVLVSHDLGQTWDHKEIDGCSGHTLEHCFTTSTGHHLLQVGQGELAVEQGTAGNIFRTSPDWDVLSTFETPHAPWHAGRSIGEAAGVIMWAEYPGNSGVYQNPPAPGNEPVSSRVFRSTDDGVSWYIAKEVPPTDIRHFHTLIPDPHQQGQWWLSSGDRERECQVWLTQDHGTTWHSAIDPDLIGDPDLASNKGDRSIFRYTDMWLGPDRVIWGTDDWLGSPSESVNTAIPIHRRAGARIFHAERSTPLRPIKSGWIGNPVRTITDLGPALLVTTEAKRDVLTQPQVYLVSKENPDLVAPILDIPKSRVAASGFTYSRASECAKDGVFFSFRHSSDVAAAPPRILKWTCGFE